MDLTRRRERYREILEGDECVHPASVFDPISARIAEDLGFEVGMFAGSIGAATVIGAPDLITLTLTEFAQQAYRICRAGSISLMVDADHGYGNALNVRRTVEELESAGVAALTIEDTLLPLPFGGEGGLISLEEGVGKMRAALSGRQDANLVVAGRTSALRLAGVDETVRTRERVREGRRGRDLPGRRADAGRAAGGCAKSPICRCCWAAPRRSCRTARCWPRMACGWRCRGTYRSRLR